MNCDNKMAETINMNINIEKDLKNKIKAAAAIKGKTLKDYVVDTLIEVIAKEEKEGENNDRYKKR